MINNPSAKKIGEVFQKNHKNWILLQYNFTRLHWQAPDSHLCTEKLWVSVFNAKCFVLKIFIMYLFSEGWVCSYVSI